jgi:hypothetical protein
MWKWFFGKADYPRFPRYGYNEKFHYLGAFWGIVLLGGSGLVRWFPGVATAVLPGWAFNVAATLHSEEALLAAGFMFVIHFFNVHMRPDKFPMEARCLRADPAGGCRDAVGAGRSATLGPAGEQRRCRPAGAAPPRWMTYVARSAAQSMVGLVIVASVAAVLARAGAVLVVRGGGRPRARSGPTRVSAATPPAS